MFQYFVFIMSLDETWYGWDIMNHVKDIMNLVKDILNLSRTRIGAAEF